MELLQLFSSYTNTTWCWFFLITCIFLCSFIKANTNTPKSKKLPPGPWKLPIIGSMHHMLRKTLPHETLSKLAKKYGSVMHLQLGEISTVVFSSPEVVKLVMKTHDLAFADRASTLAMDIITYNKSEIGFAPYSDYLRQMKKICVLDLLSAKRVKSYQPIREREVAYMIDVIRKSAGTPINLSALFSTLSSSIVTTAVFGENIHNQAGEAFDLGLVVDVLSLVDGFSLADFFPSLKFLGFISGMEARLKKAHKKTDTMLQEIIEKRREYHAALEKSGKEKKEKDIMDTLLRLQKEDQHEIQITDDNVKAITRDLFFAGTESSVMVIEWTMSELIRNPKVMEKVQSELRKSIDGNENLEDGKASGLRYLNFVIKESLRLHPPAPFLIPRECREACEINGYHIPKKTRVLVNAWGIGRDPDVWEDAEKFIPERFEKNMFEFNGVNLEYIPFGSGRRICPGITFGLATIEAALTQLLYHFNWKLPNDANGETINMEETSGLAAKRKIPLQLVAIPR